MNIDKDTVLYIVAVWLLGNAFFPLILNSLERLFQSQIDGAVSKVISYVWLILRRLAQVIWIVFQAPNFLLLTIVELLIPKDKVDKIAIFRELRLMRRAAFEDNFPTLIASAFTRKKKT
ncbi:MAG: hypothetical protein ACRERR_01255 [Moraxellaceae bacterium]